MKQIIFTTVCSLAFLLLTSLAVAQPSSWEKIPLIEGHEGFVLSTEQLIFHESETLGKLFVGGTISEFNPDSSFVAKHLLWAYDGLSWSPIDMGEIQEGTDLFDVHRMLHIRDYLDGIVYVYYYLEEDTETWTVEQNQKVVYYDGQDHHLLFTFGPVQAPASAISVEDDILYFAGRSIDENGNLLLEILQYENGTLSPALDLLPDPSLDIGVVRSFLKFQDKWYFTMTSSVPDNRFMTYDNGQWNTVSNDAGQMLDVHGVGDLYTYGDKLVITVIRWGFASSYNPNEGRGSGLIFWDGENWSAPQPLTMGDNNPHNIYVYDVKVIGSDLYVRGSFNHGGGEIMPRLARWDGSRWCGLQTTELALAPLTPAFGTFQGRIVHITNYWGYDNATFFHDGETFSPCSTPTFIKEQEQPQLLVYPNPTNGHVYFESDLAVSYVEIFDTFGKRVLNEPLFGNFIDVSQLSSGLYVVAVYVHRESSPMIKRLIVENQ